VQDHIIIAGIEVMSVMEPVTRLVMKFDCAGYQSPVRQFEHGIGKIRTVPM
jgi:hypothetical protein